MMNYQFFNSLPTNKSLSSHKFFFTAFCATLLAFLFAENNYAAINNLSTCREWKNHAKFAEGQSGAIKLNAFSDLKKLTADGPECEYQDNPLGIDEMSPRLSWKLGSTDVNVLQTAYEIRVGLNYEMMGPGKNLIWQTGKISSGQSIWACPRF